MSFIDGEMFDPADVRSILSELKTAASHEADTDKGDLLARAHITIEYQQRLIAELTPKPFNHFELKRRLSARSGSR